MLAYFAAPSTSWGSPAIASRHFYHLYSNAPTPFSLTTTHHQSIIQVEAYFAAPAGSWGSPVYAAALNDCIPPGMVRTARGCCQHMAFMFYHKSFM